VNKITKNLFDGLRRQFAHPGHGTGQFAGHPLAVAQLHFDHAGGLFDHQDRVVLCLSSWAINAVCSGNGCRTW
jgi:hypothetical protein